MLVRRLALYIRLQDSFVGATSRWILCIAEPLYRALSPSKSNPAHAVRRFERSPYNLIAVKAFSAYL